MSCRTADGVVEVPFVSQFGQEAAFVNKPWLVLKTWEKVGWAFGGWWEREAKGEDRKYH